MFVFRGRISRSTWWLRTLLVSVVFVVLFVFLGTVLGPAATWILYPPYLWAIVTLCAQRLHDRGQSPWLFLVLVIPVFGPLWFFITVALREGTPGENQYGQDPREHDADYLVVR